MGARMQALRALFTGAPARASYQPWDDFWYRSAVGAAVLAGVNVTPESAMANSALSACVRLISGTEAKVPLWIYRRSKGESRTRERDHPLYRLLNLQANRWQSGYEFRRTMTAWVCLYGNAYAARPIVGANAGMLIPLHPNRVEVRQLGDGGLEYRVRSAQGTTQVLDASQIFHLRDLSLDGVLGLSRIEQARQGIGVALAAELHEAAFFGNGAQMGTVFTTDGSMTPKQRADIKAELKDTHTGPWKAHRPTVLEAGLKPVTAAQTNRNAQLSELRKLQVVEMARWYGVPPHMIGDVDGSTSWGTGIEQQVIGFMTFGMLDWYHMWKAAIGAQLLSRSEQDEFYAEHVVDELLRGDFKTRMDGYGLAIDHGILSPDEVRAKENMNPRTDGQGDRYLRPANMVYADEPTRSAPQNGTSRAEPARQGVAA